jgi:hypothetical protein
MGVERARRGAVSLRWRRGRRHGSQTVPRGLCEFFDVVEDGQLGWATARFHDVVGCAMDDRTRVVGKELEVGQKRTRLVEGCGVKEVIGDVARPRDAVDHAPIGGDAPVLKGREVRNQRRREGLPQWVDVGHIDATGDGEKDGEHRKVRIRVVELESRTAGRFGGRRVVRRRVRLGGTRDLIRLGAWEEGEQVFLASSGGRMSPTNHLLTRVPSFERSSVKVMMLG